VSTVSEIEQAIEKLPVPQVDELACWFETFRQRRTPTQTAEKWLEAARGAATTRLTTAEIMSLTRAEE
jgi:hypothetical protein